jgi:glycosyltransferase involved in cell wall biosynthesis
VVTMRHGRLRLIALMSHLGHGGAEKQMAILLRHLDPSQFEMKLWLLAEEGEFLAEVPENVHVVGMGKTAPRDAARVVARMAALLRKECPDVVYSKLGYANLIATAAVHVSGTRVPLILSENSVQSLALPHLSYPRLRRALLKWSYRRARRVIAPSAGVVADLRDNVGVGAAAYAVIPNMVDVTMIKERVRAPMAHRFTSSDLPLVVAAGRLHPTKGHADLVAAIALLARRHACNLLLLGDGPERGRLEALIARLGIGHRVALPGFVANPFAAMAQADVFVSPSHFESFGNVITEAMTVGVPVVSTCVPYGPKAIITDGRTGIFARASDPADLAAKIALILDNPRMAKEIVAGATQAVRRYDAQLIVAKYEALFRAAAHNASPRRACRTSCRRRLRLD